MCATFWCLLLNGFVGFQFAEDGTPLSLWVIDTKIPFLSLFNTCLVHQDQFICYLSIDWIHRHRHI